MKKSVLTVLFALFCTMSFAQLSFNVKAGLNLSSYIGDNSDHSKFKPGVRLGVGMEYQFTDIISLQPSLFFSQKGAKYSEGYEGIVDADADVKNQPALSGTPHQCTIPLQHCKQRQLSGCDRTISCLWRRWKS